MKFWRKLPVVAAALALGCLASGCSGVNASGSVSPATFFLPGIMHRGPEIKSPVEEKAPETARVDRAVVGMEAGQP